MKNVLSCFVHLSWFPSIKTFSFVLFTNDQILQIKVQKYIQWFGFLRVDGHLWEFCYGTKTGAPPLRTSKMKMHIDLQWSINPNYLCWPPKIWLVLSKRNSISVFCFDFNEKRGKSFKNARNFIMIEMHGKSWQLGAATFSVPWFFTQLEIYRDSSRAPCRYPLNVVATCNA